MTTAYVLTCTVYGTESEGSTTSVVAVSLDRDRIEAELERIKVADAEYLVKQHEFKDRCHKYREQVTADYGREWFFSHAVEFSAFKKRVVLDLGFTVDSDEYQNTFLLEPTGDTVEYEIGEFEAI